MKRVTLIYGHYGSGKTNIALTIAMNMAKQGLPVTLADLDIVNPYFRSSDSASELAAAGIRLVVSRYAGSNVDVPALPQEIYSITRNLNRYAVVDVGGDDRGALALGRLRPELMSENNFESLFVFNLCRPLTASAEEALGIMREIESACGIPATGILNNTNLGAATDRDTVLSSMREARRLSELSSLPLRAVFALPTVAQTLSETETGCPVYPITLQKTIW